MENGPVYVSEFRICILAVLVLLLSPTGYSIEVGAYRRVL